jgi:DMSO/TMAO reductase YedYZ molybdopterin-dependent catalytic subunit
VPPHLCIEDGSISSGSSPPSRCAGGLPEIDAKIYKLKVGGDGAATPIELTLDDLKKMPAFEVVAVNQCSGNRRARKTRQARRLLKWG